VIVRDEAVLSKPSFLKLVGYIDCVTLRLFVLKLVGLDCGIEVWEVIITNTKVVSKLN
jgi:hypothetical protein